MKVSDILETKGDRVITIGRSETIETAAGALRREGIGALLIKAEDGAPAGIISERDVVRGLAEQGSSLITLPVSQFMTESLVTCSSESSTEEIMTQMLESRIRHLPVVDDGKLVGIISVSDVVKAVLTEFKWLNKVLQDQIATSAGWSTEEDDDDD